MAHVMRGGAFVCVHESFVLWGDPSADAAGVCTSTHATERVCRKQSVSDVYRIFFSEMPAAPIVLFSKNAKTAYVLRSVQGGFFCCFACTKLFGLFSGSFCAGFKFEKFSNQCHHQGGGTRA